MKGVEALKAEAKSIHHLMTHVPKNPYCEVCKRAKMYKPPSYKVGGTPTIEAKSFGDHIAADHVCRRDKDSEIEESRLARVDKDVKTAFMYAYPSALRSEEKGVASLQHFVSRTDNVGNVYIDNAKELKSTAKKLGWRHELSKAHIHQSNAVAERAVRANQICCRLGYHMCTGLMLLNMPALRSIYLTQMALSTVHGFRARPVPLVVELTLPQVLRPKGKIRRDLSPLPSLVSSWDTISNQA